jgi:hypothetical protein
VYIETKRWIYLRHGIRLFELADHNFSSRADQGWRHIAAPHFVFADCISNRRNSDFCFSPAPQLYRCDLPDSGGTARAPRPLTLPAILGLCRASARVALALRGEEGKTGCVTVLVILYIILNRYFKSWFASKQAGDPQLLRSNFVPDGLQKTFVDSKGHSGFVPREAYFAQLALAFSGPFGASLA